MEFGGDLAVLDAPTVCQIASMAGLTGRIKLLTADNVASLFFKSGKLIYATIDTRRKRVGEILIEKGLIDERTLETVLRLCRSGDDGRRIGEILIEKGKIRQEDIVSVIQEQIKTVVYTVLEWNAGHFAYFDGSEPQDEDILLDVRLDHLLLEGLRRLDESAKP